MSMTISFPKFSSLKSRARVLYTGFSAGYWIGPFCAALALVVGIQTMSFAQAIEAGTGAPTQHFEVANGPRTFTVTVLGGATSSGTVNITLPVGYVIVGGAGAVSGTGVTAALGSVSGNTATVNLSGIPAAGTNATFTYQAYATCAAIGVEGNQASYVFTPSGGSAVPAVTSNGFNLHNAKINITNLANAPAAAGVVGDAYTRTYRINNDGFGSIDTVYVTDVSGIGVEHVSHSVSTASDGSPVTATLLSATTSGSNTTYLYRFIISSTPQDGHLGQNEYFTFTQNLKISSCENLNTSLNAWYGTGPNPVPCVGQNDTQTTALAIDNSKQPTLVFTAITQTQPACRGNNVTQEFKVANTGTANAKDILLRMFHYYAAGGNEMPGGMQNGHPWSQVGYVPGSFKYKIGASGTYVTVPVNAASGVTLNNQKYYIQSSCINETMPNELDLTIPQLAPGEEIYFQYEETNCCTTVCMFPSIHENAIFGSSLRYRYNNDCNSQIASTLSSGTSTQLRNYPIAQIDVQEQFPADMVLGTDYTLAWESTIIRSTASVYPTGSTLRYHITLPAGIVLGATPDIKYTRYNGAAMTPVNVTVSGQEIDITFTTVTGTDLGETFRKGSLSIGTVSLDCTSPASPAIINTRVYARSAGCTTCEEQLFCGDQGVTLHCPGCTEPGIVFNGFGVLRTTTGQGDTNNDGQPDGALGSDIRNTWVSRGDVVTFTYEGRIQDAAAPAHNFQYGYAGFSFANSISNHFSALTADVLITDAAGTTTKVNKTGLPVSFNPATGNGQVDYSISALATAGYTSFADGDKVKITVSLKVTNGIGATNTTSPVSTQLYLSDAANPGGSEPDVWFCDNFSGELTLIGLGAGVYSSASLTLNECNTIQYSSAAAFFTSTGVNTGGPTANWYKNEYRQFAAAGDVTFTLPAGYSLVQADLAYTRGAAGYGQVENYVTNVAADNVSGNVYTFNARKQFADQGGPWPLPDEGFNMRLRVTLRPTCEAAAVSTDLTKFQFVPGPGYTETLPAGNFTVQLSNQITLNKSNLVVNAGAPVQTVTGNTVTWEVQVANTQPGTTPKVWMGENNTPANGITIQSVQQITGFGGATTGSALTPASGMYQLGAYGQESRYYRITATFTNCGEDVLPLAVGYVCGDYPASLEASQCKILTDLTVIPTGANLQVSLIGQPAPTYPDGTKDLCEELEYTAEVKNPAQGTAYDLTFTVKKPAGVAYIANSYQLSPTILPAPATLTAVNNDAAYVSETAGTITFTIPASVAANLPYNAGYTIRYRVETVACEFVSNTKMTLQALGNNGCGSAINGTQQQTQTIRIKGENPNPNAYTITSSVTGAIQACDNPDEVLYTFAATNNGPVATYAGEKLVITLPKPYVMGSITGVSNFSGFGTPTATSDATHNIYTWTVPAGIAAGQVISFTAPLSLEPGTDATTLVCGNSAAIKELIAYTFESTCVKDNSVCTGSLQAEGENESSVINVVMPAFSITAVTASQTGDGELSGTVTVANSAPTAGGSAQSATLNIYHDVNNDGVIDGGDILVGTQAISLSGAASEVIDYTVTTSFLGELCPALVEVTPTCACVNPVIYKYACDVVLPVNLQSFEARQIEGGVSLSWTTTSETKADRFDVQRSADVRNWTAIGTVKAKGESIIRADYNLTDGSAPGGINYYRLKMIDQDGTFAYSQIRSVAVTSVPARLYPNPVTDVLILNPAATRIISKVELLDSNGKAVHSSGAVSRINVARLSAGIYILRISYGDGGSDVQRVIKK